MAGAVVAGPEPSGGGCEGGEDEEDEGDGESGVAEIAVRPSAPVL